ncbi:hypothetical protein Nepgr_005471 [Nepenthes gracilis]|uniref:Epidermal patterning factor-like protein n=1 Tax=Nepenthes gracilis TaxID=150966 RepID=A0AAD3S3P3_NEPGR|nr:hypothetical protein Nepgr_005471 [Nepenthes gracilis]
MAPARRHHHIIRVAATLAFITSLSVLTSKSVGLASSSSDMMRAKEKVLGSKPPGCENKCKSCKPCMATLVVPPHQVKRSSYHGDDADADADDIYYLLSWKCKCGNKLFQP